MAVDVTVQYVRVMYIVDDEGQKVSCHCATKKNGTRLERNVFFFTQHFTQSLGDGPTSSRR